MPNSADIAFTSAHVCDTISRRKIKEFSDPDRLAQSMERVRDDLIIPLAKRMAESRKMPRGSVKKWINSLSRKLAGDPSVMAIETTISASSLSTKERGRITFVVVQGDGRDWLDFSANEARLARKTFQISCVPMDFRIHRHTLSRFMHREMKPFEVILGELQDSMRYAALFGALLAQKGEEDIAVPLAEGMLFGRIYHTQKLPPLRRMEIDSSEPRMWEEDRPNHILGDGRVLTEMMTYIDEGSLSQTRIELRDALWEFGARHDCALHYLFQYQYYEQKVDHEDRSVTTKEAVRVMIDDAIAILDGPLWDRFVTDRRAHG